MPCKFCGLIQKDDWALAGQRCKCDLTLFIHHGYYNNNSQLTNILTAPDAPSPIPLSLELSVLSAISLCNCSDRLRRVLPWWILPLFSQTFPHYFLSFSLCRTILLPPYEPSLPLSSSPNHFPAYPALAWQSIVASSSSSMVVREGAHFQYFHV